jgi:uncharacterized protein with HEPN domain
MKDNIKLLEDMLHAIASIESYTVTSFDLFLKDEKVQDAIMFNLVVLGEAANQISREFQDNHPEIPWSSIIGTRNVIIHGYDQIKLQIVWDITQKNLQSLKLSLLGLI